MDLVRHLRAFGPLQFIDLAEAKQLWADYRGERGFARIYAPLLSAPNYNVKFMHTLFAVVYGLALSPWNASGWNVCRFATRMCRAGCVAFAGKGTLPDVQRARIVKTQFLADHPHAFFTLLFWEIGKASRKHGHKLRVRLNTFADIPWEEIAPDLFDGFPSVQFYDYTKWPDRQPPSNYTLVRSASELMADNEIPKLTAAGTNVAVAFRTRRAEPLPVTYMGVRVIDGDQSDDRTKDPKGVIVGLRAKGLMRKREYDGFVRTC